MKTIEMKVTGDRSFVASFDRPGRVEVFVVDGALHAHFYDGVEVDMEQEPLFAFDGTLPVNNDCRNWA